MPTQTSAFQTSIRYPDGAKVEVKAAGEGTFTDIGFLSGAINNTFNYTENFFRTANGGDLAPQIKNMEIASSFNLISLAVENINRLGGGLFNRVVTAGTSVVTIDNQVITSGSASDLKPYNLSIVETGANALRVESALVIASVTGATDGLLVDGNDYYIMDDSNSPSGKSISFDLRGTALTTLAQDITIVYTSVTPVASETLTMGSSTETLSASEVRFTHTDDAGKMYSYTIYAADPTSGGFQFNFLGAEEDGVQTMPITLRGRIDVSRNSKDQLASWTVDSGAV